MRWWMLWGVLACSARAEAQISPPGLGEADAATWFAVGVRQQLDARRSSMTYVGLGAVEERARVEPAIFVLNEEVYDQFAEHWSYSLALSYRRQNEYALHDPTWLEQQQELRFYTRFSHLLHVGRLNVTTTFRPEARTFYTTSFAPAEQPLELRFRIREQLALKLDARGLHKLTGSAEVLSATRKSAAWSKLAYRESRFCLYYSLARDDSPVVLNVGYMNDLLGPHADAHYLAVDVTWQNPFGQSS